MQIAQEEDSHVAKPHRSLASELHQRCSNPGAIIFRYTDGDPYVTADVQVDGKPLDAAAENCEQIGPPC